MKLPLALLLLASASAAQHAVLVVDDAAGPGVDFTNLQTAIDAAGADDLILVRSGTYSSATPTSS